MAGQWLSKANAIEWIDNALRGPTNYNFIVSLSQQDSPQESSQETDQQLTTIGSIGLFGDWELGYLMHPSQWGKGFATEAVAGFVDAVWKGLPECEKVTAYVDSENVASLRLLRRCGFVECRRGAYVNRTLGDRVEVVFEARRGASGS